MIPFRETAGRELMWRARGVFSRAFDLTDPSTDSSEPYATLAWRRGLFPPADGETSEGRWELRPRGFWRSRILVTPAGSEAPVATFLPGWTGGVLKFEDGRRFRWRRVSWWRLQWVFESADGTPLVRLRHRFAWLRAAATIVIEPAAAEAPEAPLLALLGWYLMLLARRRHAASHGS